MSEFRESLARLMHSNTQVDRTVIFEESGASEQPINLIDDSAVMFAGYVGERYLQGGCVLVGINPGGGGDAYVMRTPQDARFHPLLLEFKNAHESDCVAEFDAINRDYVSIVPRWNLWKVFRPTIEAAGVSLEEVAYLNIVPYRTREDRMPRAGARWRSWSLLTRPLLDALAPSVIIALGKKAGNTLDQLYFGPATKYCVPRTIGDRRLSEDALDVFTQLERARRL